MSELSQIALLNTVSVQVQRYGAVVVFIFGTVGNLLNCLALSQRGLRSNSCTLLFLFSSMSGLVSILVGLTTRILASWNSDPTGYVEWLCKTVTFTVFVSRNAFLWLIMLATIDRWLSSSASNARRQMSSVRNARRCTIAVLLLSIALYVHILYCYGANLTDAPLRCYGRTTVCRLMTDITYMFVTILFPLLMMAVFGLMTIWNIRRMKHRVIPTAGSVQTVVNGDTSGTVDAKQRWNRKDRHLVTMLFVQVILLIVFFIPLVVQKLYSTIAINGSSSRLQIVTAQFLSNTFILLSFTATGMPFYIYTLAGGPVFRRALSDLLSTVGRRMAFRRG